MKLNILLRRKRKDNVPMNISSNVRGKMNEIKNGDILNGLDKQFSFTHDREL